MKANILRGIAASVLLLVAATGGTARGQSPDPRDGTNPRVVDVRPILIGREFGDGLVPLHVAPDGVQLWARMRDGQVWEWIATDSALLDGALGERHDWRGPDTLLFTVMKHPTLFLTPFEGLRCEGLAPIQHAPGGFQLWVRLRQGLAAEWIVTDSRALDGILGDAHGWSQPITVRKRASMNRDEISIVGQTRFGPVIWWVPVAPG